MGDFSTLKALQYCDIHAPIKSTMNVRCRVFECPQWGIASDCCWPYLRRSRISANAPAGRATRTAGKVPAACTRATIKGEGANDVISQAAATSCIQVPILETMNASQSQRNSRIRKGLQALGVPSRIGSEDGFTLSKSVACPAGDKIDIFARGRPHACTG
jgi:hypothetical protein